MAIKRKLSDQIARLAAGIPEQQDLVHIHVPPADAADDIIRGSEMFVNTVSKLVEERNDLKLRLAEEHNDLKKMNEELRRKIIVISKLNDDLIKERELCRRQTHEYVRANGEVGAIIGSMLALAERASHANTRVQIVADEMPVDAPQPREIYDINGMPFDVPPQITLEEIERESMSTVLARVEGVS